MTEPTLEDHYAQGDLLKVQECLVRKYQRFELVKAALTGLLANPNINAHTDYLSMMAIRQADATLAELEKNQI
jgi:hypothetical protein